MQATPSWSLAKEIDHAIWAMAAVPYSSSGAGTACDFCYTVDGKFA
jgi:hypothetical protein